MHVVKFQEFKFIYNYYRITYFYSKCYYMKCVIYFILDIFYILLIYQSMVVCCRFFVRLLVWVWRCIYTSMYILISTNVILILTLKQVLFSDCPLLISCPSGYFWVTNNHLIQWTTLTMLSVKHIILFHY